VCVCVCTVVQIELLSSGAAAMAQAFQHRSRNILGHKLLTIPEIKQHMQRQGGNYKVTRVSFKVVKQHAAFAWLQVGCCEVGSLSQSLSMAACLATPQHDRALHVHESVIHAQVVSCPTAETRVTAMLHPGVSPMPLTLRALPLPGHLDHLAVVPACTPCPAVGAPQNQVNTRPDMQINIEGQLDGLIIIFTFGAQSSKQPPQPPVSVTEGITIICGVY